MKTTDYTIYYRHVKDILKIGRRSYQLPDSVVKENSEMRRITLLAS